jgi:hypothetical protein
VLIDDTADIGYDMHRILPGYIHGNPCTSAIIKTAQSSALFRINKIQTPLCVTFTPDAIQGSAHAILTLSQIQISNV